MPLSLASAVATSRQPSRVDGQQSFCIIKQNQKENFTGVDRVHMPHTAKAGRRNYLSKKSESEGTLQCTLWLSSVGHIFIPAKFQLDIINVITLLISREG